MMRTAASWAAVGVLLGFQDGKPAPLTDDEKILHVLSRLTPGATPELVEHVRKSGLRAWLDEQLKGDIRESVAFAERLKKYPSVGMSVEDIFEHYDRRPPEGASPKEKDEARRRAEEPANEMLAWIVLRAVYGNNPVREASCDFFRNHLAVSIDKDVVRLFVVEWERDVILANALGSFGTMLEKSAKHPAMLFYLDNWLSRRPLTTQELKNLELEVRNRTQSKDEARQAVDQARQRGLNENYARELMELHSLGVDKFYTQNDVISVAKCLTGWTFKQEPGRKPEFHFDPARHCPGSKPFLDGSIPENKQKPVAEGEMVLYVLRKHEGTARFVSWKLCRWLVNDEPDEAMVKRVARIFFNTEGDLPKVFRAIVDDPKFFARENFRAKYKRPWEFVVSALRVTHADISNTDGILRALQSMNESLYRCADPTGYYDQAEAWADPGAIAYRWAFAGDMAAGRLSGVKIPSSFYDSLPADNPKAWKDLLVAKILPVAGLGPRSSEALDRLIEAELRKNPKATPPGLGARIVAALLGTPEFQMQ